MEHLICKSLKKSCRHIMGKGAYSYYFLALRINYNHHRVNCTPLFNGFSHKHKQIGVVEQMAKLTLLF